MKQKRIRYDRLNYEISIDESETSSDESEEETRDESTDPISDSYSLFAGQLAKPVRRFYIPFCGLVFYVMAFLGFFCSLSVRVTPESSHSSHGQTQRHGEHHHNQRQ